MVSCSAEAPALALRPHRVQARQGAVILAELDVDLRQPHDGGRRHGLPGRQGLVELLDRLLQVVGAAAGLVELPLEQVESALHLARQAPLLDLAEHRLHDRLGLLGITGLEDRPGGPELVLRLQAAEPQRVLEILAAEVLLLG